MTDVPESMKCRCPKCVECRYPLLNKISQRTQLCFSCRMGIHYGAPPEGKA